MISRPRRAALAVVALLALAACDDDERASPTEEPIVHGPFAEPPSLDAEARESLPEPLSEIGEDAEAHFYWWNPAAAGNEVRVELVAESAPPLELGATIHVEEHEASGEQGRIEVHPREFNRGGTRRDAEGSSKWVEGVYRIEAQLDGEPFADTVFEVH